MDKYDFPPMLQLLETPRFERSRLIIGLSGWMDGGSVSTGTVELLINQLQARQVAAIDANSFYLYNFPGPMEISTLFRPHVTLRNGLLAHYSEPQNAFFADESHQLLLFLGREPNLQWHLFTQCLMAMARAYHVYEIYFIGSVAGLVPHTREPRFTAAISREPLRERIEKLNIKFSDYEGPAGIANLIMRYAQQSSIDMISLVAEIPSYIEGRNPKCIEAITRRLCAMIECEFDLSVLRTRAEAFEQKVTRIIEDNQPLLRNIKILEENYDQEVFNTEMGDLKTWLQQQGIRLD